MISIFAKSSLSLGTLVGNDLRCLPSRLWKWRANIWEEFKSSLDGLDGRDWWCRIRASGTSGSGGHLPSPSRFAELDAKPFTYYWYSQIFRPSDGSDWCSSDVGNFHIKALGLTKNTYSVSTGDVSESFISIWYRMKSPKGLAQFEKALSD